MLALLAACAVGGTTVSETFSAVGQPLESPSDITTDGPVLIPGDGVTIAGTLTGLFEGERRAAVLLLHQLGSDRRAWEGFAQRLAEEGFVSLAIDLRGHGETGGAQDWELASEDVTTAWEFMIGLRGVDSERMAVVGASIGGNLALRVAAERFDVRAVAALSPGLEYQGVTAEDAVASGLDRRPVFLVAQEGDTYSAETVRTLAEGRPWVQTLIGAGSAHGTAMLDGELERRLISFLTSFTD
jgi:pimeloyl-ACP methyl ester carboxylesterase